MEYFFAVIEYLTFNIEREGEIERWREVKRGGEGEREKRRGYRDVKRGDRGGERGREVERERYR